MHYSHNITENSIAHNITENSIMVSQPNPNPNVVKNAVKLVDH